MVPRRGPSSNDPGPGFCECSNVPAEIHAGIVVFRPKFQDKPTLIAILQRLISTLARQTVSFALSNMTASDIGKIETPC